MRNRLPKAPKHLSREAKRLWGEIVAGWDLDAPALKVLETVCEALDRMRQAQADIAKRGALVKDRFGQLKQNPAVLTERDCRQAIIRGLKMLGLDLEPVQDRPGSRTASGLRAIGG